MLCTHSIFPRTFLPTPPAIARSSLSCLFTIFFIVPSLQAAKLRKELHAAISLDVMMGVSVGMQQLSRSGGGGGSGGEGGAGGDVGDDERKTHQTKAALRVRSRLASLRKARVVVATACAFEHAICQVTHGLSQQEVSGRGRGARSVVACLTHFATIDSTYIIPSSSRRI